jgi:MFS family permease
VSSLVRGSTVGSQRAERGARATYVAFIAMGVGGASWAARLPQIRTSLQLSPAQLGLVLLCVAIGSLVALPLAGLIVHHFTSRRTVATMAVVFALGLSTACIGYHAGVIPVALGFLVLGFANGAWDVGMNVQGAIVERQLGRAIMPRFHAGYSVGAVSGALIGAAMVALHVSVTAHLLAIALLIAVILPIAVRGFVPDVELDTEPRAADTPESAEAATTSRSHLFKRWLEPRTLLIGLFVLAFGFAEGAGSDWISIALIDGYHLPAAIGTLGFATFLVAMTAGRWFGPAFLDRRGRIGVLRGLALVAVVGIVLFVYSPVVALAFVGAALWGLGASLGFPVGISAASDDPAAAAGRVSVVASIAYCAFLGGPPLIGFLGAHVTVLRALIVVAVLVALSLTIVGALKPLPQADRHPDTAPRDHARRAVSGDLRGHEPGSTHCKAINSKKGASHQENA